MIGIEWQKDERLDRFLRLTTAPAAKEYRDELTLCAKNTVCVIPPLLDQKCMNIIAGRPCCLLKSVIKIILVAAVSVLLLTATSFAIYTSVRHGLQMKLQTEPEGSRISFISEETADATEQVVLSSPRKIELSYIPEGFECVYQDDEVIRYTCIDGIGCLSLMMREISLEGSLLWNTENSEITPITYKNFNGYKSIRKNTANGLPEINIILSDPNGHTIIEIMFLNIEDTEIAKILEGAF